MTCWICHQSSKDHVLLPESDDKFVVPKQKSTYILKQIDNYNFLYYIVCYNCLDSYLNYHPNFFKKVRKREIYGKN